MDEVDFEAAVLAAVEGCCMDATWRGHACQYHEGYIDGLEVGLAAVERERGPQPHGELDALADRIWGIDNWIFCPLCPDGQGEPSRHPIEHHDT